MFFGVFAKLVSGLFMILLLRVWSFIAIVLNVVCWVSICPSIFLLFNFICTFKCSFLLSFSVSLFVCGFIIWCMYNLRFLPWYFFSLWLLFLFNCVFASAFRIPLSFVPWVVPLYFLILCLIFFLFNLLYCLCMLLILYFFHICTFFFGIILYVCHFLLFIMGQRGLPINNFRNCVDVLLAVIFKILFGHFLKLLRVCHFH